MEEVKEIKVKAEEASTLEKVRVKLKDLEESLTKIKKEAKIKIEKLKQEVVALKVKNIELMEKVKEMTFVKKGKKILEMVREKLKKPKVHRVVAYYVAGEVAYMQGYVSETKSMIVVEEAEFCHFTIDKGAQPIGSLEKRTCKINKMAFIQYF
jgi:hypothetical protein